jgi:uncharacterized phage-associated protein
METIKDYKTIDTIVLSNYILKHYGPMSHLKLQKLVYYCDAYSLAYFGKQLITDDFEAWVHGPVCRRLYDNLKDKSKLYSDVAYTSDGVDVDKEFSSLTSDQQSLITSILDQLSTWTSFELESSTHQEDPWINARKGYSEADKCCVIINKNDMKEYYCKEIANA